MNLRKELWEIKYEHPEVILGWAEDHIRNTKIKYFFIGGIVTSLIHILVNLVSG